MSNLSKQLKEQYNASEYRQIPVPEWATETKPGVLYVKPLTMGQRKRLVVLEDDISRVLGIIHVRAKQEDGSPFFTDEEMRSIELYGSGDYGPKNLGRVAALIQEDINADYDDEGENLEKK